MMTVKSWIPPDTTIKALSYNIMQLPHVLIGGTTGSGKSVLLNRFIYDMLAYTPEQIKFIFFDIKGCELITYRHLPHTLLHATDHRQMLTALKWLNGTMSQRYQYLTRNGIKSYPGTAIYIVIDELADIRYSPLSKQLERLLVPLLTRGRAVNIHVIGCTQRPTSDIIKPVFKANFTGFIGLRTVNGQESRNIIGVNGCEQLPLYGYCYFRSPLTVQPELYRVDMLPDDIIRERVDFWEMQYKKNYPIQYRKLK